MCKAAGPEPKAWAGLGFWGPEARAWIFSGHCQAEPSQAGPAHHYSQGSDIFLRSKLEIIWCPGGGKNHTASAKVNFTLWHLLLLYGI